MTLSNIEQTALVQIRADSDWLKQSLIDYVRANPACTVPQASAYIESLTNPNERIVGIVDRTGFFQWYLNNLGVTFTDLKNLILAHSDKFVMAISPDNDRPALNANQRKILSLIASLKDKISWEDAIDFADSVTIQEIRETSEGPTKGYLLEERRTGVVDGAELTARRQWTPIYNEYTRMVEQTHGNWELL